MRVTPTQLTMDVKIASRMYAPTRLHHPESGAPAQASGCVATGRSHPPGGAGPP
ncbi:MAG TPA: hypothetical protein VHF45_00335 [Thermoleophilaceae bacterium]|nr:hypothetical protein [Thermoleophilaceae bacterium]